MVDKNFHILFMVKNLSKCMVENISVILSFVIMLFAILPDTYKNIQKNIFSSCFKTVIYYKTVHKLIIRANKCKTCLTRLWLIIAMISKVVVSSCKNLMTSHLTTTAMTPCSYQVLCA